MLSGIEEGIMITAEDAWFDQTWGTDSTLEEKLWRAVIARAMLDSLGQTSLQGSAKDHAIAGGQRFFTDGSSLPRICALAGIDSRNVQTIACDLIAEYENNGELPDIVANRDKRGRPRKLKVAA
jgi:hypothetical protein